MSMPASNPFPPNGHRISLRIFPRLLIPKPTRPSITWIMTESIFSTFAWM
jgi:hypothetical protein